KGMSVYDIHRVDQPDKECHCLSHEVDHQFVEAYGLHILAGRNFSPQIASDDSAVLINASALSAFGFGEPEEALGFRITTPEDGYLRRIIGVVENFHHLSLHNEIQPLTISLDTESRGFYSLKITTNQPSHLIEEVEKVYQSVFPGNLFTWFFLDDFYNQQYQSDRQFGEVFGLFAFLAIFISSLGLFGLATLMALKRTREIGIRRILGAEIREIMLLLSGEYFWLILIANLLAIPASFYWLSDWLDNFAFRMDISPVIYLLTAVLVLIIAAGVIIGQIWRAAHTDPVESLRYE
ncbi:MAG: FtsX-like permease family protein, partial [Bacteroidetes bacterium]|nr:FtsX-like permease family protein [Bacteroidota bacterium]